MKERLAQLSVIFRLHRLTRRVVQRVRDVCTLPVLAKLTPNVTDITSIAQAAADGGADAVTLINTFLGMAIDWRRRRPILSRPQRLRASE